MQESVSLAYGDLPSAKKSYEQNHPKLSWSAKFSTALWR